MSLSARGSVINYIERVTLTNSAGADETIDLAQAVDLSKSVLYHLGNTTSTTDVKAENIRVSFVDTNTVKAEGHSSLNDAFICNVQVVEFK